MGQKHGEHLGKYSPRSLKVLIPRNPLAILGIFKSLKHRNFAIYFAGMGVSLIGAWIQQVAMGWLVYNMTDSVFMLSVAVFLAQIPSLLFTPFTGVISDRFDRRTILMCTQGTMMCISFILGTIVITGVVTIPMLFALSFILGTVVSVDAPARQSFYSKLVPAQDLSNAIALNSTAMNGSRFIGPAIGGVLIANFGEAVCFYINGLSFLAILTSLFFIRIPHTPTKKSTGTLHEIHEGFSYVLHSAPIRGIIALLMVFSFFGVPFPLLMPAFAKGVLGGNSEILGTLTSCIGVGALAAALYLAARKSVIGLGRVIVIACSMLGCGLVVISFVKSIPVAYVLCVPIGFGMIAVAATCNTMLQALVDDEKRGRVMSIFTMAFFGVPPVGSIVQGYLAKLISLEAMVMISGIVCIIAALVFEYFRPMVRAQVRDIYARKGLIMPEIAKGLQAATRKNG